MTVSAFLLKKKTSTATQKRIKEIQKVFEDKMPRRIYVPLKSLF
jgi:hypothetical protein